MRKRATAAFAASLVVAGAVAVSATAAGPPAPTTYNGAKTAVYATGMDNPTSFAWVNGTMFAGDSGNSSSLPNGGVYVIKNHVATEIPSNLLFVGGLATHNNVLYVSAADFGTSGPQAQILAWSGWNGTTFTKQKVVYTAPMGFQGFNGLAFGANGRIYVGADVGLLNGNDHGPASTSPYLYDILSMKSNGTDVKVFAKGIRQAWQLTFAQGSSNPIAGSLGQDCTGANPCDSTSTAANPPDHILKIKQGQNYGFPTCNGTATSNCTGFAKPWKTLTPHWDPMGVSVIGNTLYVGSFLGASGTGGALYSMPVAGGALKPVVTGFPLATDALAAHAGALYVGGSTEAGAGIVYKVTLKKAAVKKPTHKKHHKKHHHKASTGPTFTG